MIDELPEAPDPATDTPQVFSQKAAASVLAQRALPGQINAAMAEFSALAAGGAYAFAYIFDSATADADPGPGKLRLSSATQNAATVMRIDVLNQAGVSLAGLFDALQAVTSSIKGAVRIVKQSDPSKWLLFDYSAIGAGSGYRNMSLTYRAGSATSPFANGDALMIYLDRNGDSAVAGVSELLRTVTITEPTVEILALNEFKAIYDYYIITLDGFSVQGNANITPFIQMAEGGILITTAAFYKGNSIAGLANFPLVGDTGSMTTRARFKGILEIGGANQFSKCIFYRGYALNINTSNSAQSDYAAGEYNRSGVISGFKLSFPTAVTGGVMRIYGMKNQ